LYYYHEAHELIFVSEIKAIKCLELKLSINNSTIYNYLHQGYFPKELTVYNEINKVKLGHILKFQNFAITKEEVEHTLTIYYENL
jgi:asparagine synthetase B (glutamine-hydrolysing)